MRILLLYVSMPEDIKVPEFGKKRRVMFPSLTLAQLASLFPDDYDIILCNEDVEDIPYDEEFDMVGISFYGIAAAQAFLVAKKFRDKGIPVVFGGPAVTTSPELCKSFCDSMVIGEAETSIKRLISDLESGKLAPRYSADYLADISSLPVPRYNLLNKDHYMGVFPVQTARGCTFQCSFCSIAKLNNYSVRYRPIDDVLRDVKAATSSSGTNQIFFVDDNINMNPKRAKELFEALIPLKIEWHGFATSIIGKQPELLRLASESGCRMLFIGFESLNYENLQNLNKPFNRPDEYKKIISTIHDHGIHIMPSFIFGLDGEDQGVFERTLNFIESNRLSFPLFHILTPIPGTPLYEKLESEGRILEKDLSHYDGNHVVFRPNNMESEHLQRGFDWIINSTYSLPSIFRRTVLRHPIGGWRALKTQIFVAGINLYYWRKAQIEKSSRAS